jgi:ribonuclease HI
MIYLSIDGASRRNGKPDCLAAGAVFTKFNGKTAIGLGSERNSTSQRGELHALIGALGGAIDIIEAAGPQNIYLVTDSEYIFNTITKKWYDNWRRKDWVTAAGEPVKNKDLWDDVANMLDMFDTNDIEYTVYHVKGHLLSLGKVTGENLLIKDSSGLLLYNDFAYLYDNPKSQKQIDAVANAKEKFFSNHGIRVGVDVEESIFREMVICNNVADVAAGLHADVEDSEWDRAVPTQ